MIMIDAALVAVVIVISRRWLKTRREYDAPFMISNSNVACVLNRMPKTSTNASKQHINDSSIQPTRKVVYSVTSSSKVITIHSTITSISNIGLLSMTRAGGSWKIETKRYRMICQHIYIYNIQYVFHIYIYRRQLRTKVDMSWTTPSRKITMTEQGTNLCQHTAGQIIWTRSSGQVAFSKAHHTGISTRWWRARSVK